MLLLLLLLQSHSLPPLLGSDPVLLAAMKVLQALQVNVEDIIKVGVATRHITFNELNKK
jgi:hypothetical protein